MRLLERCCGHCCSGCGVHRGNARSHRHQGERPGRNGPTVCFKEDGHRGFTTVPWQQSANMRRLGAVLALLASAQGFYLPGVAPTQYVKGAPVSARGDASLRAFFLLVLQTACPMVLTWPPPELSSSPHWQVELKVNKLTSAKTHLGYEYYSLPYCRVCSRGAALLSPPCRLHGHAVAFSE
jgi:hypothetical protein